MTKQEAINKLVSWALAQVGYTEGANNWNKYAPKWTAAGGWNVQHQPWCDVFVDSAFIECFGIDLASRLTYQPVGSFSAKCLFSADFYKNNGAWYTRPEVGDQIFFFVGGAINHTGIVVEINGARIKTVEGNSSDRVMSHAYTIGDGYIAGYGRPNWETVTTSSENTQTGAETPSVPPAAQEPQPPAFSYYPYTYAVKVNLLKKGSYGPQVVHMQQLLKANGFDCGEIDGKFGDQTEKALRDFQTDVGIEVDGEWGGQSFKAMWDYQKEN